MRIAIGNGVRTDVWSEFLERFGDIKVRELYAATEGNIGFINYTSKVGAVGRVNALHRVSRSAGRKDRPAKTPQFDNMAADISANALDKNSQRKSKFERSALVLLF